MTTYSRSLLILTSNPHISSSTRRLFSSSLSSGIKLGTQHPKNSRSSSTIKRQQLIIPSSLSSSSCFLSTNANSNNEKPLKFDPSKLVAGVTMEQYENNPDIQEYIQTNFPEFFEDDDGQESNENGEEGLSDEELLIQEEEEEIINKSSSTKRLLKKMKKKKKLIEKNQKNYPLNIHELHCYLRDPIRESGSRSSFIIRSEGYTPGLIYGSDPTKGILSNQAESKIFIKTPTNIIHGELDKYHRLFECRVYDLTLYTGGEDNPEQKEIHRVMPRNVQRHPISDKLVYCVNFLRYFPGRPIHIPVKYINEEESNALKRNGFVLPINKTIECIIDDAETPIPEYLELECTGAQFNEKLRLDRVNFPTGVRPSDNIDVDKFLVGSVWGSKREKNLSEDEPNTAAPAGGKGKEEEEEE